MSVYWSSSGLRFVMSVKNVPGLCTYWTIFWQDGAVSLAKTFVNDTPMRRNATEVGSKPVKSLPILIVFGRLGRRVGGVVVAPSRASPIAWSRQPGRAVPWR